MLDLQVCNFVVKDPKFSRIVEQFKMKKMGLVLVFERFYTCDMLMEGCFQARHIGSHSLNPLT